MKSFGNPRTTSLKKRVTIDHRYDVLRRFIGRTSCFTVCFWKCFKGLWLCKAANNIFASWLDLLLQCMVDFWDVRLGLGRAVKKGLPWLQDRFGQDEVSSICYLSIFSYILIRWLNSITVSHGSLPIRPISLGFFLPLDTIELSKLWKQRSSPCRVLLVWRCCEMVTHTQTHTTHRHTHTQHRHTHTQTRQHTKQNSQGGRYLVLFSKQPHHPKSTIGQG